MEFLIEVAKLAVAAAIGWIGNGLRTRSDLKNQNVVRYGQQVAFRTLSGRYMKADCEDKSRDNAVIVAHNERVADWELFVILPVENTLGNHLGRKVRFGDWVVIRAANERFLLPTEEFPHALAACAINPLLRCAFRVLPEGTDAKQQKLPWFKASLQFGTSFGLVTRDDKALNFSPDLRERPAEARASIVRAHELLTTTLRPG